MNSGVGVGTVRQLLVHRNLQTTQCYAELSGRVGYNYASSSTVRQEMDAFARRKTRKKTMRIPNIFISITATVVLTGVVSMANGQETTAPENTAANSEVQKWIADKARYEAEKAALDAKLAVLKAQIGEVPESGYSGDVKVGTKAGEVEAALLAAKAVDSAATVIAKKISNRDNSENSKRKILLYAASQTPDFQAYLMFNTQLSVVDAVLMKAGEESDKVFNIYPKTPSYPRMLAPLSHNIIRDAPIATTGLALNALNKILGYFRTDYAVAGIDMMFEDSMLVHALAEKFSESDYDVQLPAIYNPAMHSASASAIIDTIFSLAEEQQRLRLKSEEHKKEATYFTAEAAKDSTDKNNIKAASAHTRVSKILDAAVALCDTFFLKITTTVDGNIPLSDVILENALVEILKENGHLLIVKIQKVGGAYYTKKNIRTLFGGLPLYHMGGVVVSFVLLNGPDGSVKVSGVVPIHGGFVKADKVETLLETDLGIR